MVCHCFSVGATDLLTIDTLSGAIGKSEIVGLTGHLTGTERPGISIRENG